MPNHMLLMSFSPANLKNMNHSLNVFMEYVFNLTRKKNDIKIAFIGTANEDSFIDQMFFSGFLWLKFRKHLNISKLALTTTDLSAEGLEDFITQQDILFVGGGNTENMMKIWEGTRFTEVLNTLKNKDHLPILAGVSAGGMYPFEAGLSDCSKYYYRALPCFGWIKGSFCPHADSLTESICFFDEEKKLSRMAAFEHAIDLGVLPAGYAIPDDAMLHFYGDEIVKVLSSREGAECYFVSKHPYVPGTIKETLNSVLLTHDNVGYEVKKVLSIISENIESLTETEEIITSSCHLM